MYDYIITAQRALLNQCSTIQENYICKIMHIMQMEAKASAYKSIAKW